ncbi:MAG: ABC transporter ATP-binding protein [Candidatus Omnitrophota bacterium]|nr:ABC transporter ATP-binding protein [Anaerolineaceae bacterium]
MTENKHDPVIKVRDLTKVYKLGVISVHALRGIDLDIYPGEMVAIMGQSGSGKSTLMNMIGCLDSPSDGEYYLDGELVSDLVDDELAIVRNRKIGFIFQKYNLLARASAIENVELPLRYSDDPTDMTERSKAMLRLVGLGDRMDHKPNELSGGQQQRVAVARALVNNPAIVLADEPTGNLDSVSGQEVMDLLLKLHREKQTTIVVVTHDQGIASQAQRIIHLFDGKVVDEEVS